MGQVWSDAIEESLAESDAAVFLVGPEWVGEKADGSRRIDEDDDPVRSEVAATLDEESRAIPVPVLVDREGPPADLPASVEPLFGNHHFISTTHGDLAMPKSSDYQHLLVGVWEALRTQHPGSVLVIGDDEAQAPLHAFVEELKRSKAIDAQRLSRFAAGAYLVTPRRLRAAARRWPDAIVVGGAEQPSEVVESRIKATDEHPSIATVALVGTGLVGAGVLAGLGIAQATTGSSLATGSGTSFVAHAAAPEMLATVPQTGSVLSAVSSAWAEAALVAKIGIAAAAVAIGGGGVAVAVSGSGSTSLDYAGTTVLTAFSDDERSFPLGNPPDVTVAFGPAEPTEDSGAFPASLDAEFLMREVTVTLSGQVEPVALGSVILPTSLPTDYLERSGDGTYRAAAVAGDLEEGVSGLAAATFCYEVQDPSKVVGGWRYGAGAATLEVRFLFDVVDAAVAATSVVATVAGPGVRQMIVEVPADFDLTRCPVEQEVVTAWTS